jgi:hypothetical protein
VIHEFKIFSDIIKKFTGKFEARPYPTWYLDKTTEATQCSQLLICVRYVNSDSFKEEILSANLLHQ